MLYVYYVTHEDGRGGAVLAPSSQVAQKVIATDTNDQGWLRGRVHVRELTGDPVVIYADVGDPPVPEEKPRRVKRKVKREDHSDESDSAGDVQHLGDA